MDFDFKKAWTRALVEQKELDYPAEYLIRIIKGKYPRLNLDKDYEGKKVCDVGCGSGRNMVLLKQCGFDVSGMEVTQEVADKVTATLKEVGVDSDVRAGTNDSIPFGDEEFDHVVSWNACYYMGDNRDFSKHVSELARIIKKGGYLILSIPKKTCFIYKSSEPLNEGYRIIRADPFNVRNGDVLKMFESQDDVEKTFSSHFTDFIHGSVDDDCFGFEYCWHLTVCKKK